MTGKMPSTVPETTQVVDAHQLRAFPIPLIQTLRFRGARGARETGLTWPRDCGCRARAPAALPAPRRRPSASQLVSQSPVSTLHPSSRRLVPQSCAPPASAEFCGRSVPRPHPPNSHSQHATSGSPPSATTFLTGLQVANFLSLQCGKSHIALLEAGPNHGPLLL